MTNKYTFTSVLAALMLLCLAGANTALAGSGEGSGMTKTAGDYKIALHVLPAEKFVSTSEAKKSANAGEMVNGGGADPVAKSGEQNPNHHLVAFIKKNGKPVTNADVKMSYQKAGGSDSQKTDLPVTTMWVAGKGKKTTHYGNNVHLKPGKYKVHMSVNGKSADFNVTVK